MRGLVRALVAGLPVVPLIAVITVTAAPAAHAENNGVGLTPAMGWSSWSFLRHGPTAANIEAEAAAMKSSGLASVGYGYVNLDDFWYQCPGSQGPAVDQYGRWVIDSAKFPADAATGRNGIQAVAGYVHSLGLKFGLYVTPGISASRGRLGHRAAGDDQRERRDVADGVVHPDRQLQRGRHDDSAAAAHRRE